MRKPVLNVRLAVTGVGIICSIGRNQGEVWRSIRESRAGIARLTRFPGETFPTDLAAEVDGDIDALLPMGKREARRLSRSDRLAVIAAAEAIAQANESASGLLPTERTIVSTGTSTGGLLEGEDFYFRRLVRGRRRTAPSSVLQQPTSGPGDAVARVFGLGGGVISNATACASARAAIGIAPGYLRAGPDGPLRRWAGGGGGHAHRHERERRHCRRRRLHQRPWHRHAAQRLGRNAGRRHRLRRSRSGVVEQVVLRPHPRRGGRCGSRHYG